MAHAAGYGAKIYLDKVPTKEPGLAPWEIWVSESQERMMLSVKQENIEEVLEIFDFYDVEATVVGVVEKTGRVKAEYEGVEVLNLELDSLIAGVCYNRPYEVDEKPDTEVNYIMPDLKKTCLKILSDQNVGSRESVIRRYDHEVRASTVIKPMCGVVNMQTHSDASVLKPLEDSWRGLAVTCDVNPFLTSESPYWGSASALDEAIRNLTAVNAKIHTIVDCLNFGNPEKPKRFGDFKRSVEGLHLVADACGIPFVSGNVSLYNEAQTGSVAPTPALMTLGIVKDIRKCISADAKKQGNLIYIVGETHDELRGSQYHRIIGEDGGLIPKVDPKKTWENSDKILSAMDSELIASCHDISEGGLFTALAEMCIGGGLGVQVDLSKMNKLSFDKKLFSESNGRWLIEVDEKCKEDFESKVDAVCIGRFTSDESVTIFDGEILSISLDEIRDAWDGAVSYEVPR
jgi:phosphoribosylformylglycinamidine synthase